MKYSESLDYILSLVDYERMNKSVGSLARYDLEQIREILASMGNPHLGIPTAHITGTKGKGSTASMMSSILVSGKQNPGLFTSPHLHTFRERIQVAGSLISEAEFAYLVSTIAPIQKKATLPDRRVTLFEFLTAMAFQHFRAKSTKANVLEVGLGGRLDATNIVDPTVCGITSIGIDHVEVLGHTIEEISWEKSGIIKEGVPVISSPQKDPAMKVIRQMADSKHSPLTIVGPDIFWKNHTESLEGHKFDMITKNNRYRIEMPLLGSHQVENACVAVGMIESMTENGLAVQSSDIEAGLKNVQWPCRMELIRQEPNLLLDGAHTAHSAKRLAESMANLFPSGRFVLVVGLQMNKDLGGLVKELSHLNPTIVITTKSRHPKAMPPGIIATEFRSLGFEVIETETVADALSVADNKSDEHITVIGTGSLFVASEMRELIMNIPQETYPAFTGYFEGNMKN